MLPPYSLPHHNWAGLQSGLVIHCWLWPDNNKQAKIINFFIETSREAFLYIFSFDGEVQSQNYGKEFFKIKIPDWNHPYSYYNTLFCNIYYVRWWASSMLVTWKASWREPTWQSTVWPAVSSPRISTRLSMSVNTWMPAPALLTCKYTSCKFSCIQCKFSCIQRSKFSCKCLSIQYKFSCIQYSMRPPVRTHLVGQQNSTLVALQNINWIFF